MDSVNFARVWRNHLIRDCLVSYTSQDDLKTLRLVNQELALDAAPYLFSHVNLHFTTNTFSRQARLLALERIGHYTKTLSFHMPHSAETFLPPLIAPDTLEEVRFLYEPHIRTSRPVSSSSDSSDSKYGSWEMSDLLIKHYPPLFHAATNSTAFTRAIAALPYLQKLQISCPGQRQDQRYRRDVVDFALTSLRIAVEQVSPPDLQSLCLNEMHPASVFYLRPQISLGCSPASTKVWRRIKTLEMTMDSFPFDRDMQSDHLKILHTYLQSFTQLEHLDFKWLGDKGPCPLSLHAEPCTTRPSSLDCANVCPRSSASPSCKPIKFRHLQSMRLHNASLDSEQAARFITTHRKVLHEFSFDDCHLRSGTWDDALAPLSRLAGNQDWKQKSLQEEVMDVPLVLSHPETPRQVERVTSHLWDDPSRRSRGIDAIRKLSLKTKDMLPGPFRRLLHSARVVLQ